MKVLGIIPARYDSIRFPGKPLVDIDGQSMIQRVYQQSIQSKVLNKLIIATDDQRIFNHVTTFGGQVEFTSNQCKNGTERCAEVLLHKASENYDAVINIQGDEPILNPEQIDQLADLLLNGKDIATLAHTLAEQEKQNPNIVKVAVGEDNVAIGFSRDYDFLQNQSDKIYKHIGLYGFKTSILKKIVQLQPTPNEVFEKLEQLRWLDHGYQIQVGITIHQNYSVDVPDDVIKILKVLNKVD